MRRVAVAIAALVVALGPACSSDGYGRGDAARATGFAGSELIEDAAFSARQYNAAIDRLCEVPEGDRTDAIAFLLKARTAWRQSEVFWFGPVMKRFSNSRVDWQPKPAELDKVIDGTTPPKIDAVTLATFGSDTRGFGASEYVLSRADLAGRPCDFLRAASQVALLELDGVKEEWTSFAAGLDEEPDMALDDLVNSLLETMNRVSSRELGVALGELGTSKQADPSILIEGPQGWSSDDLRARLGGVADAILGLNGDDGRKLLELEKTLTVEVVQQLGVTVGFSDADGDSAG